MGSTQKLEAYLLKSQNPSTITKSPHKFVKKKTAVRPGGGMVVVLVQPSLSLSCKRIVLPFVVTRRQMDRLKSSKKKHKSLQKSSLEILEGKEGLLGVHSMSSNFQPMISS
jgi:hypothetical protein